MRNEKCGSLDQITFFYHNNYKIMHQVMIDRKFSQSDHEVVYSISQKYLFFRNFNLKVLEAPQ